MIRMRMMVMTGLLLLGGQATALEFKQVSATESSVTFAYKQMGVPLEGKFNQFTAQISFDPARLNLAQARIDIGVSSIDTGSAEADEEVLGKLWFNAKSHPVASFVASGIRAVGANRYEATGRLSIKGKTLDISAPVTFQASGTRGVFDGSFTLKRLDYAIGEGAWADVSTVANDIQIRFHLVVNATSGKK